MDWEIKKYPCTSWQLIKGYWWSEERWVAFSMLLSVLVFTVILVMFDVAFTVWYNYFYDALQDYNKRAVISLMIIFLFLAAVNIVLQVYRFYIQSYLGLRWRRWLTKQLINIWLRDRNYYYLENFDQQTDNPDQRIQEDANNLVQYTLSLLIGLISSVVTIVAFIYVLWTLSGTLVIPLGTLGTLHVSGYLVWVGFIYSVIGTYLAFKIGRPLVRLNFEQQRREANFRFSAIDVRRYSEHIALYRGEHNQKTLLQKVFSAVLDNWYAIILRQKLLLWFTGGYNQAAVLLPLAVALPNYFNKVFKLGGFMQTIKAFGQIQDALSYLVNSYTTIAEWQAINQRLLTFLNHMNELKTKAETHNQFSFSVSKNNDIDVKNLNILTPKGENLLANISQKLVYGQDYVIKGRSGVGKSTFVRTLAGIWPYGAGKIALPKQKLMYLPQTAYMPLGTLREALLFPDRVHLSNKKLIELMERCDLQHLTNELDEVSRWTERLSPGELQRIAFLRVLVQKPDWVFLDESTSSLDLPHEDQLYKLLKTELPHCSIVSVGHRPSLDAYHSHEIDMEKYSHP